MSPRSRPPAAGSELAVLLPYGGPDRAGGGTAAGGIPRLRLRARYGLWLVCGWLLAVAAAQAQTQPPEASAVATLVKWAPLLLSGFLFNLVISFVAMASGTVAGAFLGIAQISLLRPVRALAWFVTQFFRNAPWLVLLFFVMFLFPFRFSIGGLVVPLPDWMKATFGLALPVMANVSEIVRGAIQSISSGQWEAADSLAFSRRQTLWMIILPQCIKRMLPPWMNLYAILTMATVLASVVGVNEMLTLTQQALAAENEARLLVPFYGFDLVMFFIYCYPIARFTIYLERKYAVKL